jgi:WD40 repeat protein
MAIARIAGLLVLACSVSTTFAEEPRRDQHGDPLPPGTVARLGSMYWRHPSEIRRAYFSPDGKTLVTVACDHHARVWEAATGKLLQTLPATFKDEIALAFSPDSRMLATPGPGIGHGMQVWDVQTGRTVWTRTEARDDFLLRRVHWSADGKSCLALDTGKRLRFLDAKTGKEDRVLSLDKDADIVAIRPQPDGGVLVGHPPSFDG